MQMRHADDLLGLTDDDDSDVEDLFSEYSPFPEAERFGFGRESEDGSGGRPASGGTGTLARRRPGRRRTGGGTATLADLHRFSRAHVRDMIRRGRTIDCADLAIEIWIRFGDRHGVPVSFRVWDSTGRRWLTSTRSGVHTTGGVRVRSFASTDAFVRWAQINLGARNLIGNTFAVTGGHRRAVAGDVFLWQWRNIRTGRFAATGHTQILDSVSRGTGGPMTDRITVFQGNLPPVVPERRVRPAQFFYTRRTATLSTGPHTGIPVGPGPRRFNAFRSLR